MLVLLRIMKDRLVKVFAFFFLASGGAIADHVMVDFV